MHAIRLRDAHDIPDGFAFLIDDDGTFTGGGRGRSETGQQVDALTRESADKNTTIRDLQGTIGAYSMALFASAVNEAAKRASGAEAPAPTGRNRPRTDR